MLNLNYTLFEVLGYPLGLIETAGTISGILSVALAIRSNRLSWLVGMINILASFILFYQVGLYSGMILQVYFLGTGIYGWFFWKSSGKRVMPVTVLTNRQRLSYLAIILVAAFWVAQGMIYIQKDWPNWFPVAVAFPFWDALAMVAGMFANWFMARRKLENWSIWLTVDILYVLMYVAQEIYLYALLYFVFCIMAILGWNQWKKERMAFLIIHQEETLPGDSAME